MSFLRPDVIKQHKPNLTLYIQGCKVIDPLPPTSHREQSSSHPVRGTGSHRTVKSPWFIPLHTLTRPMVMKQAIYVVNLRRLYLVLGIIKSGQLRSQPGWSKWGFFKECAPNQCSYFRVHCASNPW